MNQVNKILTSHSGSAITNFLPRRPHAAYDSSIYHAVRACAHIEYSVHIFSDHLFLWYITLEIDSKIEGYKVGGNTFWCEFCQAVVNLKESGIEISDSTMSDDHFVEEGMRIEMWTHYRFL